MTGRRHLFRDRIDAGSHLATRLGHLRGDAPVVVGLRRGGVPVAAQVARELDAPLDVILIRKLGVCFSRNWRWVPLSRTTCASSTPRSSGWWRNPTPVSLRWCRVVDVNCQARDQLICVSELAVVPGATHLFEEPDTLHRAELARDWFVAYL